MSEVIVITSGKGGVGKTTTVANIGTGLAMLGKKVVVVDTDIGLRNLDVVLGLETIRLCLSLCCRSFSPIRRFTSAIRSSFFNICNTLPLQ